MRKRICVVGVGRWGSRHASTLRELGCLAGLVDIDTDALDRAAPGPDVARDATIGEALSRDYDGFVVATPAQTHFAIAREILTSRKPVLVEKPLALNAAEARELVELADTNGVGLMVGHVLLFHPAIRRIHELIGDGKLGKLQYLYSNRLNLGTVRTEENILWSFAPHDISIFQYLIGTRPVELVSRGAAFLQTGIHDSTLTILKYPNNISGHIFVSWLHPFKEHRLVIIGAKGMFTFEDGPDGGRLQYYEKGIDWVRGEPVPREGPTEVIEFERCMPLKAELEYFLKCLDNGPPQIATGQSGVEVLEILEDATSSLLSGVEVRPRRMQKSGYYVHPTSVIDENVEIGQGTKIWHFSHVQTGARIGANCSIGQNVNIGNNVRIGSHCKIQNNVSVYEGVELEDHVFCGPSMTFTNILDPRSKYPQRGTNHYRKTHVKEGASIGANATIICGNTLGRHCFIAAGAVVSKDVPDYALVAGVPARQVGWACECGERLGKVKKSVKCGRCGRVYEVSRGKLRPAQEKKSTPSRGRKGK